MLEVIAWSAMRNHSQYSAAKRASGVGGDP